MSQISKSWKLWASVVALMSIGYWITLRENDRDHTQVVELNHAIRTALVDCDDVTSEFNFRLQKLHSDRRLFDDRFFKTVERLGLVGASACSSALNELDELSAPVLRNSTLESGPGFALEQCRNAVRYRLRKFRKLYPNLDSYAQELGLNLLSANANELTESIADEHELRLECDRAMSQAFREISNSPTL